MRLFLLCICWVFFFSGKESDFWAFRNNFIEGYRQLNIPGIDYDYRDYFKNIPADAALKQQETFFRAQKELLTKFSGQLPPNSRSVFLHIGYEIDFNLSRIALERQWADNGRKIPAGGLYGFHNGREWYRYFIKKYTSTDVTPEEVFEFGKAEVKRVQAEIEKIRLGTGLDSGAFLRSLLHDSFFITDKNKLVRCFETADSMVRKHLPGFIGNYEVPPVYAIEWADAVPSTPPGIYLNRRNTAYGRDVFMFNFYGRRYNKRQIEWLYMHEAVPGHHLQSTLRKRTELQDLFLYPGNFEGWACYVEYLGKDLGLFSDPYSYLGKWEWDLVRSVRLVLDAGIHYYGWDYATALQYWKANIPGQDDIAEREIMRVTNWCAQALSYKVGAAFIMDMKRDWLRENNADTMGFHAAYLNAGGIPLTLVRSKLLKT